MGISVGIHQRYEAARSSDVDCRGKVSMNVDPLP